MKNVRTKILAILVLASACQQNGPVDAESPVSSDASAAACLDAAQANKTLPYKPPASACSYPKTLLLSGEPRAVNVPLIRKTIEDVTTRAVLSSSGPRCVDGCAFTAYADFVPKLKSFLAQGRSYEKARDCQVLDNQSIGCSSGPDDWTNRGWSYFIRDLLTEWDAQRVSILDGNEVSADLIKAYLSE